MKSTFCATCSRTARRASASVATPYADAFSSGVPGPACAAGVARPLILSNLRRQCSRICPERQHGGHAGVGVSIELVDQRLARVILGAEGRADLIPKMHVRVDEGRHHRLPGEVDVSRARGGLHVAGARANLDDAAALDEQRAVFDRGRRAGPNQPGPLEDYGAGSAAGRRRRLCRHGGDDQQRAHRESHGCSLSSGGLS